ncbi:SMP-30/gluconolactonase/LRE family protein [Ancylobacter defluvii]|uniref:Senescence marker protein-30 n=1 Tax=Ancylobacter defluvii TaxID=1282440 RepID=A0A9W6NDQ1_9HYPH|nr:SMP-30/gluconolactonase/LRE family protein [Ancylobacter defluvii]MBS7588843.1 SMP-30/gluconolactonase/LRE family protein [Ancylobacter defluvii]GLK86935.1 senescence marker protein-30 [Ancylobacter defluvii]
MDAENPAQLLIDSRCEIGESPLWDAGRQALFWVDIPAGTVFRLDLASGAIRTWDFAAPVGSLGLARSGHLVVAVGGEVRLLDIETGEHRHLAVVEPRFPEFRLNDGKIGPDGAFWVGSMHDVAPDQQRPAACLYRVTANGRVERKLEGFKVSNGLAWTADGRTMFHTDSRGPWIDRWDFDPSNGALSARHRLRELSEAEGRPDGGACDTDGLYWSCGVSAGCLNGFDAEGRLARKIPLPVPAPTMPCFGGAGLSTLYLTSLRKGVPPQKLADAPTSGGVLALEIGVAGVPVSLFEDAP